MFIDRLRTHNPGLVAAAVALHQEGALLANTYLLDTDAIAANVRAIRAAADAHGLQLYAMTKQFGRNPDACDAIVDGGHPGHGRRGHPVHGGGPASRGCASGTWATWCSRTGARRTRSSRPGPEVVTLFDATIAERVGAAAVRAGREQAVLLRVVAPGDRFYFGHGGGFPLDGIVETARRIDAIRACAWRA